MIGDVQLSPVQRKIFECVREFRCKHGCAPRFKDLQLKLGWRSTGGVNRHIQKVVDKGALVWERGKIRTLRLSEQGDGTMLWGCLQCARLLPNASTTTEKFATLTVTSTTSTTSPTTPKCSKCQSTLARLVWAHSTSLEPEPAGAPAP